ncbi:hypothetical protein [Mucilaginibacter psychrotolerans]|uniref:Uncharacterized protein n=1 Tax=Mucilaginibacter psychrotolerans TaxID=1524096 RepID=A0A4Y8S6Q9_9SPHI|nr:hypothetical protein [Mucilaginibacter psychrotolerans]TFF34311.1 hypothetical protein E2R66_22515 [Mucilaginibacter psychrotolerans]
MPIILNYRSSGAKYLSSLLFTTGIVVAGLVIPKNEQVLLHYIKLFIVPVIEVVGVTFLIVKVRQASKAYKNNALRHGDFYDELKKATFTIIPNRIAYIVSSEIGILYYLFFHRGKIKYDHQRFSYHKDTGTVALFSVLVFMVLMETAAIHLLLAKWNNKAAWIISGLSVYAALQLMGVARALFRRPIEIRDNVLILRYGVLAQTEIPLTEIESIKQVASVTEKSPGFGCLSPLNSLDSYNMLLELRTPASISFIYGRVKTYSTLAFHVDDKILFKETINSNILRAV